MKPTFILPTFLALIFLLIGCIAPPASPLPQVDPAAETAVPAEPTNTPLPAQTQVPAGEPCSSEGNMAFIDEAYADYQTGRASGEISELTDWVTDVAADLAVTCNRAVAETTDPAELSDLLAKLHDGGYVIYVRHTHTDRSRGDTDVSLGECDQQRILSDRGRDEALFMRNAYQKLDLPVSLLLSTQYCRTLETAVLAFGVPQVTLRTELTASLTERLATAPEAGTNTIIVAHIGTIRNAIGLDDTFEEGDSLVYRPDGAGGYAFVGRIGLYDWPILARLNDSE